MKTPGIDVSAIRKLGSNVKCIGCPEWAVVMIYVRKFNIEIPLCDACQEFVVDELVTQDGN